MPDSIWGPEIQEVVRILGSEEPFVFQTPTQVEAVMRTVTADLCFLSNELAKYRKHRLDTTAGWPRGQSAIVLTPHGEELLKQLQP